MRDLYLGIDVGSVSTNLVVVDGESRVTEQVYLRTNGRPIPTVQKGLAMIKKALGPHRIGGVGTTGSARHLIGLMVGADLVKNEITTHAVAALHYRPDVRTIIEIGGQDSKLILVKDGIVVDFAMNTVCAAGTGSFLDQQAARLNLSIEEFSALALAAENPVAIAGRCAVFAESDMIHKQQMGHSLSDIAGGLCEALVRNYLNNVAKGKELAAPVIFQGGVAANQGIRRAFQRVLGTEIIVPEYFGVMGAFGAALLVRQMMMASGKPSRFAGWRLCEEDLTTIGRTCQDCSNHCELVELRRGGKFVAFMGDRCGKWSSLSPEAEEAQRVV
ncbi:MAG TPA: 2-hydroxyglutaryl-CoA dehydratase [Firmicutes bacterium]|nr:2-hydroxyglutaryl-CoA dehydratase [Bacillota bacterium]HOQ24260.1 acyl-CoA dehydratase activase [Bacillota bacterium]HPT66468.1 acyl-CoA dehydratase activase [Bacillota bacterium]